MQTSAAQYKEYKTQALVPETLTESSRTANNIWIYIPVFAAAICLCSLLINLDVFGETPYLTKKIIYALLFAAAGTAHIILFKKFLPQLYAGSAWVVATAIGVSILVTGTVCYLSLWLSGFGRPLLFFTGTLGFILPLIILLLWRSYTLVTEKNYTAWHYDESYAGADKTPVTLDSLRIHILVKMGYFDAEEKAFEITVMGQSTLDKAFHQFIQQQQAKNIKIHLANYRNEFYGWRFLLLKKLGTTLLNPYLPLNEIGVKPDDTIIAERIKITG